MSYQIEKLISEISHLKWQKADNYKLDNLQHEIVILKEKIISSQNYTSYLLDRIEKLENRINETNNS